MPETSAALVTPVNTRLMVLLVTATLNALAIGALPPPEPMMSKLLRTVWPWAVTLNTRLPGGAVANRIDEEQLNDVIPVDRRQAVAEARPGSAVVEDDSVGGAGDGVGLCRFPFRR